MHEWSSFLICPRLSFRCFNNDSFFAFSSGVQNLGVHFSRSPNLQPSPLTRTVVLALCRVCFFLRVFMVSVFLLLLNVGFSGMSATIVRWWSKWKSAWSTKCVANSRRLRSLWHPLCSFPLSTVHCPLSIKTHPARAISLSFNRIPLLQNRLLVHEEVTTGVLRAAWLPAQASDVFTFASLHRQLVAEGGAFFPLQEGLIDSAFATWENLALTSDHRCLRVGIGQMWL